MKRILWQAGFALVLFALCFVVVNAEDEKGEKKKETKPTLESFPEAVQKALKKQAGENTISKVEKKGGKDHVQYAAEWKTGDKVHEAYVSADGTLLKTEDDTDAKDVPEKVQKASKAGLPEGSTIIYTKIHIVKGDKTFFEAAGTKDGKQSSFFTDNEGNKVKASDADEDEEDEDGEEEDDDDDSVNN